jgi:putative ABC transport system permease protein
MPARVGLDVTVDYHVLAVTIASSVFTALVVSAFPVLYVRRVSPGAVLKDGAAGAVRRRSLGQRALAGVQVAASLVLLASAAIVFNTFRRVLATNLGFDSHGLIAVIPDLRDGRLDSGQVLAYRRGWLARAAADPSIAAVAEASTVPPASWASRRWVFRSGEEPPPGVKPGNARRGGKRAYVDVVSAGFFDVMRLPIRGGRSFTAADDQSAPPVAIVSQQLASELWPRENPLGKMLSLAPVDGRRQPAMRVVGLASDVAFASVFDKAPSVAYMPAAQHPTGGLEFIVRSREGSATPDATLRRIGASADPRVLVYTNVVTDLIDDQLQPQRVASVWIGVFGAIALLLAAVGLYGVVAQGVLQRTREIAVRSALGATPGSLVSLVIGDGMRIAAYGTVAGVLGAAAALRVLQSQFDGVSLIDVRAAGVAAAVLSVTMLGACYAPARRAARLNPINALRSE